jgi:dipeptidase E
MKKLVLHSSHVPWDTKVDQQFLALCGKRPEEITLAYIPSSSDLDWSRRYFNEELAWYSQFGIPPEHIMYFDVDKAYYASKEDELFSCDAISLSWGNTFSFLHALRQRWFIEKLRAYVDKGGILIGLSAGAILMSETIRTAWWFWLPDDDINVLWLKDLSALEFNAFDFFPHYVGDNETIEKLKKYAIWKIIYAVKDGDGIIVNGKNVELIWDVAVFQDGEIISS